jgi:7-carboxy-7-deazaguanine synthase
MLRVSEIFRSIQGEGPYIGRPMGFVRLAGCNLRCKWCDTKYAWEGGEEMEVAEVLHRVHMMNVGCVSITGGEPLLQRECMSLIYRLLDEGYMVLLETNGTQPLEDLPTEENLVISMDIKTPSSGFAGSSRLENIEYLHGNDYVKFVIADETDYNYAVRIMEEREIPVEVIFQPAWGTDIKWLAERVLEDGIDVRVLPQLHRIIWGDARGV